eukprot:2245839-Alexandrium_andersonii.AAC.1
MAKSAARSSGEGGGVEVQQALGPLLQWAVASGCSNHDCHNALKWSLHHYFQDAELLKEICIAVE